MARGLVGCLPMFTLDSTHWHRLATPRSSFRSGAALAFLTDGHALLKLPFVRLRRRKV